MGKIPEIRILGVDLGEKRTGIAVTDPTGTLAGGVATLSVNGLADAAKKTAEYARDYGVSLVIVGNPINMDGSSGPKSERSARFADILRKEADIPVVLHDERLTTSLAHVYMNATGRPGKKRKEITDMLSAQILLQGYIDMKKNTDR